LSRFFFTQRELFWRFPIKTDDYRKIFFSIVDILFRPFAEIGAFRSGVMDKGFENYKKVQESSTMSIETKIAALHAGPVRYVVDMVLEYFLTTRGNVLTLEHQGFLSVLF
jgi:hypothetical protein